MAKDIKSPFVNSKEEIKDSRFSAAEMELLRKLDEESLKMFRSVFYQDVLTEAQNEKLKSLLTPELVSVIEKFFNHDLNWQDPLFGMPNRWNNPRYDSLLLTEVPAVVKGRQMAIRFLESGVARLRSIAAGTDERKPLEFDIRMKEPVAGENVDIKAKVVAMQDAVQFLESALQAIHIYIMSPEDLKSMVDRIKKNSAK